MNDAQEDLYAVRQVLVGQRDKPVLDQCRAILDALAPRVAERERAARAEALREAVSDLELDRDTAAGLWMSVLGGGDGPPEVWHEAYQFADYAIEGDDR